MRRLLIALLILVLGGVAVFWFVTIPATVPASALAPHTPDLANGKTMFDAGGCAACHAPNQDERTRLGGGVALKSPFGTFFAPHIPSDRQRRIGAWDGANFVPAIL